MQKIIVVVALIVSLAACNAGLLGITPPIDESKWFSFKLDKQMRTKISVDSIGDVLFQVDLNSFENYFIAPSCVNCKIFDSDLESAIPCNNSTGCTPLSNEYTTSFDADFWVRVQPSTLALTFSNTFQNKTFNATAINNIHQLKDLSTQTFFFNSIGIDFDVKSTSSFLKSVENDISYLGYSLFYYTGDYYLKFGAFKPSLLSSEFFNLNAVFPNSSSYSAIQNNLVYGAFKVTNQTLVSKMAILIDPTADKIILPGYLFDSYVQSLKDQGQYPTTFEFTPSLPGNYYSQNSNYPNITLSFEIDDQEAYLRNLDLTFTFSEFFYRNTRGYFTPRIEFDQISTPADELYSVIRVGTPVLQRLMYFKYLEESLEGDVVRRCLALLRNPILTSASS